MTGHTRPPRPMQVLAYAVIWLASGIVISWVFFRAIERYWILLPYLLLHAFAGGLWLASLLYRLSTLARLQPPRLNVLNSRPHLGEHVPFDVRLETHKPLTVDNVVTVLSCREELRKLDNHYDVLPVVVFREENTIARDIRIEPDEPKDVAGEFVIPPNAMQSFESHVCALKWQLDVLVFVGKHLAYREGEELSVQPVVMTWEDQTDDN